jgi:hypothetical protein
MNGFGHQEFQFSGFIPTHSQAGLIISFNQEFRPTQMPAQSFQFFNGRRQVGKGHTIGIPGCHNSLF